MFWHYYLENKKPTFLACIPKQVYAVILKSSKNDDLFQNLLLPDPEKSWKNCFSFALVLSR